MTVKKKFCLVALPVAILASTSSHAMTETERKIEGRLAAQVSEMKESCPECYRASAFIQSLMAYECFADDSVEALLDISKKNPVYMNLMMVEIKYGREQGIVDDYYEQAKELIQCDSYEWSADLESWWDESKDSVVNKIQSDEGSVDLGDGDLGPESENVAVDIESDEFAPITEGNIVVDEVGQADQADGADESEREFL